MASIAITVTTSAGAVTFTSPTLTDPQMARFTDYCWGAYPQYQADGVTPKPKNAANVALAVQAWAAGFYQGTKANVVGNERAVAAAAAADAIADLP